MSEEKNIPGMEEKILSQDELEAVSGGRDWMAEGCAATVEAGSSCWGTDACSGINVHYQFFDASVKCPNYPGPHRTELTDRLKRIYTCKYCGYTYQDLPDKCYAVFG